MPVVARTQHKIPEIYPRMLARRIWYPITFLLNIGRMMGDFQMAARANEANGSLDYTQNTAPR